MRKLQGGVVKTIVIITLLTLVLLQVTLWSLPVQASRTLEVVLSASPRDRVSVSSPIELTVTARYSDGTTPSSITVYMNATLIQLGVHRVADTIWKADVYSGCTTAAEPPDPNYYAYKGTVYPILTHSYFASTAYATSPPADYDPAYILRNVPTKRAPYWVEAFGLRDCFAIVYTARVYLPLSGTYTIEAYHDDGVRIYVNGVRVVDYWYATSARFTRGSINLNAGWHTIVVKYFEAYIDRTLLVGLVLPNGTAIKPLIPIRGVQMIPEGQVSPFIPGTPLQLLPSGYSKSVSGSQYKERFSLGVVGQIEVSVKVVDSAGLSATKHILLTWDVALVRRIFTGDPAEQLTLQSTFSVKPGDVVVPHLYDWFFNRTDSRVQVPISPSLLGFSGKTFITMFKVWRYTDSWVLYDFGYLASPYGDILRGTQTTIEYALKNTDGASTSLTYNVPSERLYSYHHIAASWDGSNVKLYVNGTEVASTTFTGTLASSAYPLTLGSSYDRFYPFIGFISNLLVYRGGLTGVEISNIYTQRVVNVDDLVLFIDPTFYNGTHYVDLSGKGNHAQGFGYVSRTPTDNPHLYLIKGLHPGSDAVHFKFFPPGTKIEVYDSTGGLVGTFIVRGVPNQVGLVEDYPIRIPPGTYTFKVYLLASRLVYENDGNSRRSYVDVSRVWSYVSTRQRLTVGDPLTALTIAAIYAFNNSPTRGFFMFNDTSKSTVGVYRYRVVGFVEGPDAYMFRVEGNVTTSVIYDKLELVSYTFIASGKVLSNNSRVDYTLPVRATVTLRHAYDKLALNSTNYNVVMISGFIAEWDGQAFSTTIPSSNKVYTNTYNVISYADSLLGVRFADISPKFKIYHDSINITYGLDLVKAIATFRAIYGTDGSPISTGRLCFEDSNSRACHSITSGVTSVTFNRFVNGTLRFLNATDGGLVYTCFLRMPEVLVYKWASRDGLISVLGTREAVVLNVTRIPELNTIIVVAELKGNASISLQGGYVPVKVKVNGVKVKPTIVNRTLLLFNLSSLVEATFKAPVKVQVMPGAAPIGAIYEVGFADKSVLVNATLFVGLRFNSSTVSPFLIYGGIMRIGSSLTGFSYPLFVGVSWSCERSTITIYYVLAYQSQAGWTSAVVDSHGFTVSNLTCPSKLYPYVAVLGNQTGVVDKYGAVPSEILPHLALGTLRVTVWGPVQAGSVVKYVILSTPMAIKYTKDAVLVEPYNGRAPLTLIGFKGYTLSYSVAGVSVSGVAIASNEYPLELPLGIALMVIVDPSSRTVNIVQVAVIQKPIHIPAPTTGGPYIPELPVNPARWTADWTSPSFIVLYLSLIHI